MCLACFRRNLIKNDCRFLSTHTLTDKCLQRRINENLSIVSHAQGKLYKVDIPSNILCLSFLKVTQSVSFFKVSPSD